MIRILTIAQTVWLEMIRRKDLYVLLILLVTMLFVLLSLNIFGLGSVIRYVADIGLLFAWLFSLILAITTTARQLPQEEAKRTIYPLLAKPVRRIELILGKWLGCWTITVACTGMFYALVILVVHLRGGGIEAVTLVEAVLLHLVALGVVTALALAVSSRMTYGAAASVAFVIVAACFSIAPSVPELLVKESGFTRAGLLGFFYALPHLELFDMRQRVVHEWGPAPWGAVGFVGLYGLVWILLLLLLAWLGYRDKRFKRGTTG